MALAYPLLALAIVVVALTAAGVALLGIVTWLRWLRPLGAVALAPVLLVTGSLVNVAVPRECVDGLLPDRQRPITAALDSAGGCEAMGVGQVALVPLAASSGTLLAYRAGRGRGSRRP